MSKRRQLLGAIGAGMLAGPRAAFSQRQSGTVARIGYLSLAAPATERSWMAAFEQGLRELGYVEGRNIIIERRYASGRPQKVTSLAAELVRLQPACIVTYGGVEALRKLTRAC